VGFFDESGDIRAPLCICAYFDLLGTSNRIEQCESEDDLVATIRPLKEAIQNWLCVSASEDAQDSHTLLCGMRYHLFSDSFIVAIPVQPGWRVGEAELSVAVDAFAGLQFEMALRGFFGRGAVTLGNLHMGHQLIAGPALVEAVRLEKDKACGPCWPRLILSDHVMQLVRHHLTFCSARETIHWSPFLQSTDDKVWFVDYVEMRALYEEMGPVRLIEHAESIRKTMSQCEESHREKFCKLARYHDWVIGNRVHFDEEMGPPPDQWRRMFVLDEQVSRGEFRFLHGETDAQRISGL